MNQRRRFLKTLGISSLLISQSSSWISARSFSKRKIKLGLISDLHHDVMPDGKARLEVFLGYMNQKQVDGLVQLGDFAVPSSKNQELISLFNSSHPYAFHVLGNHDVDYGHSWEQCLEGYGMKSRYYSQEFNGIQLIVLDGNDTGSPAHKGGYPSYIGPEQQEWLRGELDKTELPVLLISHQPIAGIYTIDNALEMQDLLGNYSDKILLAINGHAHVDQHLVVKGVNYLHINSASYYWVGKGLAHQSYPAEVHENYPELAYTCPYSQSLFALLTIDLEKGEILLEGRKAEWVGPSPQELGISYLSDKEKEENLIPGITSKEIAFKRG